MKKIKNKIILFMLLAITIILYSPTISYADSEWVHPYKLDAWIPAEPGQEFGMSRDGGASFHNGWDFGDAKHHGDFYAVHDAKVIFQDYYGQYLRDVIVLQTGNLQIVYQEFGKGAKVKTGDVVKKGQAIGSVVSPEFHMHLGMTEKNWQEAQSSAGSPDGVWINPKDVIEGKKTVGSGGELNESSNKGESKDETFVGEDAWKNRMINFQVNTYENTFKGIETGSTGFISNAFILNANKTSIKAMEWAYIIIFTLSIVLFFFMFSATIFYLVILPNGLGGMKVANFYEKTTGISPTVNKQTTIDIIGRLGLTTFLVACIYANLIPMFISNLIQLFSLLISLF